MASLSSTRAGQGADSTDLDPELDVQLASKTSHLTLSSSGSEAEAGPRTVPDDDFGSGTNELSNGIFPHGQEDIEVGEWREAGQFSLSTPRRSQTVAAPLGMQVQSDEVDRTDSDGDASLVPRRSNRPPIHFCELPNEVLLHILSFLEVCDLLSTSRTSHHLRDLSLAPHLHLLRLRHARSILPPLLSSPSRPSLPDLIARHIFLTNTTLISRRLSRNLVSIRLARQLAARPSPQVLVERCVLPAECVPPGGAAAAAEGRGAGSGAGAGTGGVPGRRSGGGIYIAPGIVARKRAVERERVKDGLRRFVGGAWTRGVRERGEGVRKWEERVGVGRVWRLRRFWERMGAEDQGQAQAQAQAQVQRQGLGQ